MRRYQNAADLSGRFAIRLPQKVRMFQEILGMERLRKAKPVLLAIAAVCGLLVTVGGGAEMPSTARQATVAASPAHAHQSGKSSEPAQSSLDFEAYRTRIEPIFLKQRQGGVRCYDCHSVLATRLRLEPLSPGNSAWTTEQSRRNFEVISQLITPSDPLKSRLLLRVSRSHKPDVSFGDSVTRRRSLDRRTITAQFPKRAATGCSWEAGVKQALNPSPCARGGRRSVSFRRPAVCLSE